MIAVASPGAGGPEGAGERGHEEGTGRLPGAERHAVGGHERAAVLVRGVGV